MHAKLFLLAVAVLLAALLGTDAAGSTMKYIPPNLKLAVKGPKSVIASQSNRWQFVVRNTGWTARRRISLKYLLVSGATVDSRTKPTPRVRSIGKGQQMAVWQFSLRPKGWKSIIAWVKAPDITQYTFSTYCSPVTVFWKGIEVVQKTQWPCPAFVTTG